MKKLFLCLITLSLLHNSFSQSYDPGKVNKKAFTLYNQAMEQAQNGQFTNAADLLQQALQIDNKYLDAYLSLAGVYGQQKNYKFSTEYYEKAFAQDADYTIEYKLPYSINLAGSGQFEKALDAINELLDKKPPKNSTSLKAAEYRKRCYEFAIAYSKKNTNKEYVFAPQNMGADINTSESEYFPSLTIDGKELVFTRRLNGANEDFFTSKKNTDNWDKAKPIEGDVNSDQNEGAQNIPVLDRKSVV